MLFGFPCSLQSIVHQVLMKCIRVNNPLSKIRSSTFKKQFYEGVTKVEEHPTFYTYYLILNIELLFCS